MTRTPAQLMETYLTEVVVGGRLALIDELAREDMVDEANQAFGGPPGRAGLVAHVVGFRRNVGDLALRVERIVAGPDEVMGWWSFTGTHDGPWLNRAPTGKPISGTAFSFFELIDGRISRYRVWLHADLDEVVVFDSSRPEVPGATVGAEGLEPPTSAL
jgi:predicted ester cyclase